MHFDELCVPIAAATESAHQDGVTIRINHARIDAGMLVDVVLVAKVKLPLLGCRRKCDSHKQ
jgi:hypothetical protein